MRPRAADSRPYGYSYNNALKKALLFRLPPACELAAAGYTFDFGVIR